MGEWEYYGLLLIGMGKGDYNSFRENMNGE